MRTTGGARWDPRLRGRPLQRPVDSRAEGSDPTADPGHEPRPAMVSGRIGRAVGDVSVDVIGQPATGDPAARKCLALARGPSRMSCIHSGVQCSTGKPAHCVVTGSGTFVGTTLAVMFALTIHCTRMQVAAGEATQARAEPERPIPVVSVCPWQLGGLSPCRSPERRAAKEIGGVSPAMERSRLTRVRSTPRPLGRGRMARMAAPSLSAGLSVASVAVRCTGARWRSARRHRTRRNRMATRARPDVCPGVAQSAAGRALEAVHQTGDANLGRVLHHQVHVVVFPVHFDQLRPEVGAHLGQHRARPSPSSTFRRYLVTKTRCMCMANTHGLLRRMSLSPDVDQEHDSAHEEAASLQVRADAER